MSNPVDQQQAHPGEDLALQAVLGDLPLVSARRLERCTLLRRVDTKFLMGRQVVENFIRVLGKDYGLVLAGQRAIATYRTLYFDTPDLLFFRQHHRGRRARYKVRIRHYLDRNLSALEIKRKTNHNVTNKARRMRPTLDSRLTPKERIFISEHIPRTPDPISSQVWTDFSRITLVGLRHEERLTIDLGLEFKGDGRLSRMENLVIVEVKQPGFSPRSPAMLALRGLGLRPSPASKYCTALATLYPDIRHNRFRPTLRNIRSLRHA